MHIPITTWTYTTLNTHVCTRMHSHIHIYTHAHTQRLGGRKGERGCFIQHFSMTFSRQSESKCRCADLSWTIIQMICGGRTWNLGSEILLLTSYFQVKKKSQRSFVQILFSQLLTNMHHCANMKTQQSPQSMFRTTLCPFSLRTASTELKDPSSKLRWLRAKNSQILSLCVGKIWKICRTAFNQSSSGHQKELYFFHCDPFVSPKLPW